MLIDKLRGDLLAARKSRQSVATALLTALVGEAIAVGKNAGNRESTDEETLAMIRKFLKNAEETLIRLKTAERDTLVTSEEIAILKSYIPLQMTAEELCTIVTAMKDHDSNLNMGAIMKLLKERHGGQYDGRLANEVVKAVLG